MAKMVGTNKAYSMARRGVTRMAIHISTTILRDHGIRTPVLRTMQGVMPHPSHRVVTDDIGWGLCVGCPQKTNGLENGTDESH